MSVAKREVMPVCAASTFTVTPPEVPPPVKPAPAVTPVISPALAAQEGTPLASVKT